MGKRIIAQRRGRGSSRYKTPGFRFKGPISYPKQNGIGLVLDIIHDPGRTAPVKFLKFLPASLVTCPQFRQGKASHGGLTQTCPFSTEWHG